jgi:hypothetical protein
MTTVAAITAIATDSLLLLSCIAAALAASFAAYRAFSSSVMGFSNEICPISPLLLPSIPWTPSWTLLAGTAR